MVFKQEYAFFFFYQFYTKICTLSIKKCLVRLFFTTFFALKRNYSFSIETMKHLNAEKVLVVKNRKLTFKIILMSLIFILSVAKLLKYCFLALIMHFRGSFIPYFEVGKIFFQYLALNFT